MGQTAVYTTVAALFVAAVLLLSMQTSTGEADEALNEYHNKELARDLAMSALQGTVRKLAADNTIGSWTNGADYEMATAAYKSGTFRTDVVPVDPYARINVVPRATNCPACSGDTVDVRAIGVHGTRYDAVADAMVPIRQVMLARYARAYADGGIPPQFRNVITTDLWLQISGNLGVLAINDSLNASIHTNDDLKTNGNSFLVEGYGTYTGSEYTNQEDNFIPNIDYNGEASNVHWAPEVAIDTLDIASLMTKALQSGSVITPEDALPFIVDGETHPILDLTNSGTWPWTEDGITYNCPGGSCGTRESPFILVVQAPLEFVNRVEVKGFGIVISTENVYVKPQGNGGGVFGGLTAQDSTKLLLASKRDMEIGVGGGNTCLGLGPSEVIGNDGQKFKQTHCVSPSNDHTHGLTIHAEGMVEMSGTPYLIGGIVAPETHFAGGGDPLITYAAPSKEILEPGFNFLIPVGPILIAFSEW